MAPASPEGFPSPVQDPGTRLYRRPVRVRPELAVAGVAAVWGSIGVIVREIPEPATVIVFARVAIAAAGLGVWMSLRPGGTAWTGLFTHRPARTVSQGVILAAHWVALFAAFQRAPVGTVVLITYVAPVLVAMTAPRLLGERVSSRVLVALAVAAVGAVLVLGPGTEDAEGVGVLLAAIAAVLLAVLVINAKILSRQLDGVRLAFVQVSVATVTLVPVVALAGRGWPSPASIGWLLLLGLVHTAAALVVYFWALARMPATSASVLTYLEPAAGVVFAWWLLGEQPSAATLTGGGLIVVAGLLVVLTSDEPGPPATSSVARYH